MDNDTRRNYGAFSLEYATPEDLVGSGPPLDTTTVAQLVGTAISQVDHILAFRSGLGDIFKKDEDLTRGISVTESAGKVNITANVIAETGYDTPDMMKQLTDSITNALKQHGNLRPEKLNVRIAETMTLDEFAENCNPNRALN